MKTNIPTVFISRSLLLRIKMFQREIVEKIGTHFMFSNSPPDSPTAY